MPLPPLVNGVLPPCTYQATLAELWAAFDRRESTTRPALNRALQHAVTLIWSTDANASIFVDGSYITSKVDPIDVDLAVRSDIWNDTALRQHLREHIQEKSSLLISSSMRGTVLSIWRIYFGQFKKVMR